MEVGRNGATRYPQPAGNTRGRGGGPRDSADLALRGMIPRAPPVRTTPDVLHPGLAQRVYVGVAGFSKFRPPTPRGQPQCLAGGCRRIRWGAGVLPRPFGVESRRKVTPPQEQATVRATHQAKGGQGPQGPPQGGGHGKGGFGPRQWVFTANHRGGHGGSPADPRRGGGGRGRPRKEKRAGRAGRPPLLPGFVHRV